MTHPFSQFGIVPRLVGPKFSQLASSQDQSRIDDIEDALRKIVPMSCGHNLIRIGGENDGAYLLPDDLSSIEACFSPGTNNFKSFEDSLTQTYGISAFMCDYSSDVEKFRTPLIKGKQFFEKKWLDIEASDIALDLNEWVARHASSDSDLILQMDIEGAEYRNLLHASDKTLKRFRIIVLELHNLEFLANVSFLEGIWRPIMAKLEDFVCVHTHANNCCGEANYAAGLRAPRVIEVTFLRKDRVRPGGPEVVLPHPLDVVNVAHRPPIVLDGPWLAHADAVRSKLASLEQVNAWAMARIATLSRDLKSSTSYGAVLSFLGERARHANLALGKPARQSSMSKYSSREGAQGAVNGLKSGKFGFHTEIEKDPWWEVDLQATCSLDGIVVYNRVDSNAERARTLKVRLSVDGRSWQEVYDHKGAAPFGGIRPVNGVPPLLVPLTGQKARFIRLECSETTALHLDEVEVYGRRQT